ncbi:hypothetical protein ACFSTH_09835 [Paenibacillus yanchengensis]
MRQLRGNASFVSPPFSFMLRLIAQVILRKERNLTMRNKRLGTQLIRDSKRHYQLYMLIFPMILFYLVFIYAPMYGIIIAFKHFSIVKGI